VAGLSGILRGLDPARIESSAAVDLLEQFVEGERVCAGAKALLADRAAGSERWRVDGARSAGHWLADKAGSSLRDAEQTIQTSRRLGDLDETADAVRRGRLSGAQVGVIADVGATAPDAQGDLLEAAATDNLRQLREKAGRAKTAAVDEERRHRRIHRRRSLRSWTDPDGAWHLHATGPVDAGAQIRAALEPFTDQIFDQARTDGRRERLEAYQFDALRALTRTATGAGTPAKNGGGRPTFIVTADLAALRRGHTVPGETVEIRGVGPIPVSVARNLLGDSFLALVLHDGVDPLSVTHLGTRHKKAELLTALQWRYPGCVVPGCGHPRIDWDRTTSATGFADTGRTCYRELAPLCRFHHHQKTHHGARIEPDGHGGWTWHPPPENPVDTDPGPPEQPDPPA
jgi:hypothetical protein